MNIIVVRNYDKRYDYVAAFAAADGHTIVERPEDADVAILPFLASEDGVHIAGTDIVLDEFAARLPAHARIFTKADHPLARPTFDYLGEEGMRSMNAIPTAEGALIEAMTHSPKAIWGSRCLVIGRGHVGAHVARILHGMGAQVTMAARKLGDRCYAQSCGYAAVSTDDLADVLPSQDFIFSTAPARLMDEHALRLVRPDALVVEVVAGFEAVDRAAADRLGVHYVVGRKLPGQYSPEMAGRVILDAVYRLLEA